MKQRGIVRIISFMVVGFLIVTVTAINSTRDMNEYKQQLEVGYLQSLSELGECLGAVNTDLTKSLYTASPQVQQELSRDLFAQCSVAKNALSRLPASQLELGNVYKFLSQASDYAQYLRQRLQSGKAITHREHRTLAALLQYSERLLSSVEGMNHIVTGGAKITDGKIKSTELPAITPLSQSFSESTKAFDDYPTLLYDGPFSDQILNRRSALLDSADVVTEEQARSKAAQCLETKLERVVYASDERAKLPCYTFSSGRYTISVTKQGGYIKSLLYAGTIRESDISEDNAVRLAEQFLKRLGYTAMKSSYYATADNVCTVNFAYAKDGIYCYADLIKVGVSLSDGTVVSMDAATYLTNHRTDRTFPQGISIPAAAKALSPYLKLNATKRSIIPKPDGTEVPCYEFSCTGTDTGEDALVYINAVTGEEEDIMLLLYSDNGTLVK